MKIVIFLLVLILPVFIFAQQINYTSGNIQGGSSYDYVGKTYIDTTTSTTLDIYIDLNDFYFIDPKPHLVDSVTAIGNSERMNIGTLYTSWDNQGTASPTTDSLLYTMKVYPGVHTSRTKSFAGVDWGTAVLVDSVVGIGDTFTQSNVYLHSSLGKSYPPECIKIEFAPVGRKGCDDSTAVYWQFAYPAIYDIQRGRKDF